MAALRVVAIALVTVATVLVGAGGEAFWFCVPAALLASATCRTRGAAAIATATVVAAAAVPALTFRAFGPLPPPALGLLVPAASVTVLRAVRERLERERDELHRSAHTDPMTGAQNRRSLFGRIEYEIARHIRAGASFALVMLDLDGFKPLNDRFGHAAGDELLCDVVLALKGSIRAQDTVARIGGDEFCVLAPETDGDGAQLLLVRIAQAIGEVTAGPYRLRASVGVALFPEDGGSAAELLLTADQRLLDAKRTTRSARPARRAA